jgi:hypothetical protein
MQLNKENRYSFFYNQTLIQFTKKQAEKAFNLLRSIGFIVKGNRFRFGSFSYPLSIVTFEHPSKLGFFDLNFFEIGLNKELINHEEFVIERILKHEIAHYLTYLYYGSSTPHHGKEFSFICKKYGWEEEAKATIKLPSLPRSSSQIKITKLLNLANSKNLYEAEQALTKAMELITKHGLPFKEDLETHQMRRIIEEKKSSEKLRSIAEILRVFGVYPVINHASKSVYLEIFGQESCIEIAEYVAIVLYDLLEELWKKEPILKGLAAKNSFFCGIAHAFVEKHKKHSSDAKALIPIEKALHEALPLAYPRLTKSRSYRSHDPSAYSKGRLQGASLEINSGLNIKKKGLKFLAYFSSD